MKRVIDLQRYESKPFATKHDLYILYLCYIMQQNNMSFDEYEEAINSIENAYVKDCVSNAVKNDKNNVFKRLYKKYSLEELKEEIISFKIRDRFYISIPKVINVLAGYLLDINKNDSVIDLCSRPGYFFKDIFDFNICESDKLYGFETEKKYIAIGEIFNSFSSKKYTIKTQNLFDKSVTDKFDKIFSNNSYCIDESYRHSVLADIQKKNPKFNEHISPNWFYCLRVMDLLKDDGKAVVFMRSGDLSYVRNNYIKEYFVTKGFIETVISLPKDANRRYFDINIVVLSKNNNKVNFVNITDTLPGEKDADNNIKNRVLNIIELIGKNTDNSAVKTVEEIIESKYNLNPEKIFEKAIEIENPVKIEEVAEIIKRGTLLGRDDLDSLITDDDTNYKYVSITDIQDGVINKELKNLKHIDKRQEAYCADNGDLLISKSGEPIKVAVCEFDDNTKVLVGNNLYIIKLKKELMDPYYLQAFLNSEKGSELIKRLYVGNMLKIISIESLKNMTIENNDMVVQERIAENQKQYLKELSDLKTQIDNLKNNEKNIFLEV